MNEQQKTLFNEYEHEIKREIVDMENHALALSLIEYNPKGDGTERVNFDDNFAIHGLGAKVKYVSGRLNRRASRLNRRVIVKPVTYNGWFDGKQQERVTCLDITVLSIDDEAEMNAASLERPLPLMNDWRFAFSIYTKRESMPTDTKPEEYVKVIHEEIIPGIRENIKKLWGELGALPSVFQNVVKAANACNEANKACEDTLRLKYLVSKMIKDIPRLHD
jgi:hypothetical protein